MKQLVRLIFSVLTVFASSALYAGSVIGNDMARCDSGKGSAILISVRGLKDISGRVLMHNYPATKADFLAKNHWLQKMIVRPASKNIDLCVPIDAPGNYAIALWHDRNDNDEPDFFKDGGGFSNNPALSIFNLGKPSVGKASFYAGTGITHITINMKYV